jgi:hypothetical protein
MSVKRNIVMVAVGIIVLGALFAIAQTTSYEVKQGTVIQVYGNHLVVKMANGEVRDIEVPEGFMFTVDGRQVPVSELVPGTKLTASVATTTTPKEVQSTELRKATVVSRSGQSIVVRNQDGKLVMYNGVPENIKLQTSDGRDMKYTDLRPGMELTAHIVHKGMTEVSETDVDVAGTAPKPAAPAAAPMPAPVAKAAEAAPAALPKTASSLPLAGLAGIALLVIAIGIAVYRRF